jgi:hypothetical protein
MFGKDKSRSIVNRLRSSESVAKYNLSLIEDRLQKLEDKVFKTGRSPSNLSQQMLLLDELGLLTPLKKLNLSDSKLAILLSALLNADKDNIRRDLSIINKKDSKLKSTVNYAFLQSIYSNAGLEDLKKAAEIEYDRLNKAEEKKS